MTCLLHLARYKFSKITMGTQSTLCLRVITSCIIAQQSPGPFGNSVEPGSLHCVLLESTTATSKSPTQTGYIVINYTRKKGPFIRPCAAAAVCLQNILPLSRRNMRYIC